MQTNLILFTIAIQMMKKKQLYIAFCNFDSLPFKAEALEDLH